MNPLLNRLIVPLVIAALSWAPLPAFSVERETAYPMTIAPLQERPDSDIYLSLLFPGYSQWQENQLNWASLYSISAAAGLAYGAITFTTQGIPADRRLSGFPDTTALALKLYLSAGFLSVHHAFRTQLLQRKEVGEYGFITLEESPGEILKAPFRLYYLFRPTTFLPLAAAAALFVFADRSNLRLVSARQWAAGSGVAYLSGTSEEAFFHGWMYPTLYQDNGNLLLSNVLTSTVFALSHLGVAEFYIPWPQFILGMYLGWLTTERNWTLGEAIFLHTWFDVMAFAFAFAGNNARSGAWIPFPTFTFRF